MGNEPLLLDNPQTIWLQAMDIVELNCIFATTLDNLASILHPLSNDVSPTIRPLNAEEALLIATGAVGKALGITICPPAKFEDLRRVRDPLSSIAHASRVRIRRITLRDRWWQKDNGALLAYTLDDNRPVALLPLSDTRYEILDPQGELPRARCDRLTAAILSPTAYTFYRPLPENLKLFNSI